MPKQLKMTEKEFKRWQKSLSEKEIRERYPDIAEEIIYLRKKVPALEKKLRAVQSTADKAWAILSCHIDL